MFTKKLIGTILVTNLIFQVLIQVLITNPSQPTKAIVSGMMGVLVVIVYWIGNSDGREG